MKKRATKNRFLYELWEVEGLLWIITSRLMNPGITSKFFFGWGVLNIVISLIYQSYEYIRINKRK